MLRSKKQQAAIERASPAIRDLIYELDALAPKVQIIGPDGKARANCVHCKRMTEMRTRRDRQIGPLCRTCKENFVAETVARWKRSPEKSEIETQLPFAIRWYDKEWDALLQSALKRAHEETGYPWPPKIEFASAAEAV